MKKIHGGKRASNMLANFDSMGYETKVCIGLKRLGKKELEVIEIDCQYDGDSASWMNEIMTKISENGFHPSWMYSIQEIFVGLKTKKEFEKDCECGGIWSARLGRFVRIISYERCPTNPMSRIMRSFYGPPPKTIELKTEERILSVQQIVEIARDRGGCLCRFEMRK